MFYCLFLKTYLIDIYAQVEGVGETKLSMYAAYFVIIYLILWKEIDTFLTKKYKK